jgi:biopolymer transport protein ExbD
MMLSIVTLLAVAMTAMAADVKVTLPTGESISFK